MPIKSINAKTAKEWLSNNDAILIDVREPQEYKEIHILDAHLIPVGIIEISSLPEFADKKLIVHCKLGKRGETACKKLLESNQNLDIYNMEGGIAAWEKAGFKVEKSKNQCLSIDRQVQITIGSGVLLGLIFGYFVNSWFLLLSAFFGAGLLFSGVTGGCALAIAIGRMPWNCRKNN